LQLKLQQEIRVREQTESASKISLSEMNETFSIKLKDLEKDLALVEQKLEFSREEN